VRRDYIAEMDRQDFELTDEDRALVVRMLAHRTPPALLDNPRLSDGQTMPGCWILSHWDCYEFVGIYYLIDGTCVDMSESQAAEYLSDGY
jgi:hypothetical protein